jgi:hypothetical protein
MYRKIIAVDFIITSDERPIYFRIEEYLDSNTSLTKGLFLLSGHLNNANH